jgi:hypothetical protein
VISAKFTDLAVLEMGKDERGEGDVADLLGLAQDSGVFRECPFLS